MKQEKPDQKSQSGTSDFPFQSIDRKWQTYWESNKTFKTEDNFTKPKCYILDMFPYPSGDGLHVGHPEGYTATDIYARFKRMNGFNVLHPMGWDSFGLPAEQHAIKTGSHPRDTIAKNVDRFRSQIKSLGLSYDWDREFKTSDPSYFKWTQWIFLKLYEKGLAYEDNRPVNWCPALGTILANEEVVDGKSEVGGHPVEKKPMRQWVLRITDYAESLLNGLDGLDWPENVKEMQRNWIGKSEGAEVQFVVDGVPDQVLTVFTTRPDTLFGATYCAIAPEHPALAKLTQDKNKPDVQRYVEKALAKDEYERSDVNKDKTGVFTGAFAVNPVNDAKIPIYVADYVFMDYGSGAIMAVPAHDERDHAFAIKYGINIVNVIENPNASSNEDDHLQQAFTGDGVHINSDFINGLHNKEAAAKMIAWLEKNKKGTAKTTYKLRDWIFSRQRYWGEPIPLSKQNGKTIPLGEDELPLTLPEMSDFKPSGDGSPPLNKAEDWVNYKINGQGATRETNTMPQWAGSCWYYLRYIDPLNSEKAWDEEKEKYWMPVDLYIGGVEHAVMHLLYARFWHHVLHDLGLVSCREPFKKLCNQGMILGANNEKMSKSRGNVVNPDSVIEEWGADAFRLYEMFMGPLEASKPWQTNGIVGCFRFLQRTWRFLVKDGNAINKENFTDDLNQVDEDLLSNFHQMIKKVTEDTESLNFNTAISSMMEYVNACYKSGPISSAMARDFIVMLSAYAPHMGEELWEIYGGKNTIAYETWPSYDEKHIVQNKITLAISVNGKFRSSMDVDKTASKEDSIAQAKALQAIEKYLDGKQIVKEIYVPGKIINFIVKG